MDPKKGEGGVAGYCVTGVLINMKMKIYCLQGPESHVRHSDPAMTVYGSLDQ
jgi:hypothetical protein